MLPACPPVLLPFLPGRRAPASMSHLTCQPALPCSACLPSCLHMRAPASKSHPAPPCPTLPACPSSLPRRRAPASTSCFCQSTATRSPWQVGLPEYSIHNPLSLAGVAASLRASQAARQGMNCSDHLSLAVGAAVHSLQRSSDRNRGMGWSEMQEGPVEGPCMQSAACSGAAVLPSAGATSLSMQHDLNPHASV